jgi:hypothetical protein
MARHANVVATEIGRRLEATAVPGSPNRMTAESVRERAGEYLTSHDEDVANYPEQAGESHWDLWMMDANYTDALFAVLVFGQEGVEFFCGTGNSFDVRYYCGHDFPDDPTELSAAMRSRFRIPESSLWLDRKQAEKWLGRGW